jgi:rRNA processing protein Gar1
MSFESLLASLKNMQGQVISPELLQQLAQAQASTPEAPHDQEEPVNGETVDDLAHVSRIAEQDLKIAPSVEWKPMSLGTQGIDGLKDYVFSSDSESEQLPKLDSILKKKGIVLDEDMDDVNTVNDDSNINEFADLMQNLPEYFQLNEILIPVGKVTGFVENMLIVEGYSVALDFDSCVCLENDETRQVIGMVLDVFGAVQKPMYLIGLKNPSLLTTYTDAKLATVPAHSKLILLDEKDGNYTIIGDNNIGCLEDGDIHSDNSD